MHWDKIKENVSDSPPPVGWAVELDRGIADVDQGRVTSIAAVIGDLNATLEEMTNEANDQAGHGDDIPNRSAANERPQG